MGDTLKIITYILRN